MNWHKNRTFTPIPGIRLSLAENGLGATVGTEPSGDAREDAPQEPTRRIIRSADSCDLTSPALEPLREVISSALRERSEIDLLLGEARADYAEASRQYDEWAYGSFRKYLLPFRFAKMRRTLESIRAGIARFEEQRGLCVVKAELKLPEELAPLFERACASFAAMAESGDIWDVVAQTGADKDGGDAQTERYGVTFSPQAHPVIPCRWSVPCLGNFNGGALYIYPGFLFYVVSTIDFAVIDLGTLVVELGEAESGERGAILNLTTPSGLNERYLVADQTAAEAFQRDIGAVITRCRR
jgi:hypothetical protein